MIRYYESGIRATTEEQLEDIAEALDVPVSALRSYHVSTAAELLPILVQFEDEYGLISSGAAGGSLTVDKNVEGAPKFVQALKN